MRRPATSLLTFPAILVACGGGGADGITGPGPEPGPGPSRGAAITLALGEVRTLTAAEAASLQVTGASGGAEFTLIPFYGMTTVSSMVALRVAGEGLVPTGDQTASPAGDLSAELSLAGGGEARDVAASFDARLRRSERVELTSRIPAARAALATASGAAASGATGSAARVVPSVGDRLSFNAAATTSCTTESTRTGRVVAVTRHAVIVADETNPAGGFTDAEYTAIAEQFDTEVHPLVTRTFGSATDVDENDGRVTIFFTRTVNELTPVGARGIVFGFFNARDVLLKTGADPCPASNEAEILYALVPDPLGVVNGNRRTKDVVRRGLAAVLAHEYQHLVNAGRRVHVNGATSFEETWLNEGLSTIAEELMFYAAAGMTPRANVGLDALVSSQARTDALNAHQVGNFNRVVEHLRYPELYPPFDNLDELGSRGATWQFLRYAADRSDAAEQGIWQKLVNAKTAGVANFNAAFGTDFITLVRDWATARYVDDAVPQAPSMYQQPSWNYRSILPALVANRRFPLNTWALGNATPLPLTLRAGGAAYVRFGVAEGTTATVKVTSPSGAVPSAVSVTLVRTK